MLVAILGLVLGLVGNGEFLPAFGPAGSEYPAPIGGGHSFPETMFVFPLPVRRLKCPFHILAVFFSILLFFGQ